MATNYGGRSLAWVRELKDKKPKYATARAAYEDAASRGLVHLDSEPPVGAVVWFANGWGNPMGDVGISIGNWQVLRMQPNGEAIVQEHHDRNEMYSGWSESMVLD